MSATESRPNTQPRPRRLITDHDHAPRQAIVWMVLGAAAFSGMGACAFALGNRCDWLVVAAVRAAFMFVSTAVVALLSRVRLVFLKPSTLWIRSFAGSFSLVCNFYAMTRLPVGDVLTITNTYPLWIILATAIGLRRLPSGLEVLGVLAGLLGVVLIQQPELSGDRLASLIALLSSFSTTVAMLGLHRLGGIDPRAVVVHFAGVAGVISLIGLSVRWSSLMPFVNDPSSWLLLLGVGVSGTLGQVLLTKAYAAGAPTRVSIAGLSQVVFGVAFDVLVWHRRLPLGTIAGMALILAPTVWLTSRPAKKPAEAA
jgi:drug/metabolite transporter (DMT)-like permease